MKLVYSSDLHGAIDFYRQLLELAVAEAAQVAIIGGDLFPHALHRATALDVQRAFVHQKLAPLLHQFKQQHPRLTVYCIPGNDDWAAAYSSIAPLTAAGLLVDIHHRATQLTPELWINGSGLVGLTPFAIKDFERRDTPDARPVRFGQSFRSCHGQIIEYPADELLAQPSLADELAQLTKPSNPNQAIYVFHSPPSPTRLDRRTGNTPAGSRAIYDFIHAYQPLLTFHGHVHESPRVSGAWLEEFGRTIAINPGQSESQFHAVVLETDNISGTVWHTVYGRPGA